MRKIPLEIRNRSLLKTLPFTELCQPSRDGASGKGRTSGDTQSRGIRSHSEEAVLTVSSGYPTALSLPCMASSRNSPYINVSSSLRSFHQKKPLSIETRPQEPSREGSRRENAGSELVLETAPDLEAGRAA